MFHHFHGHNHPVGQGSISADEFCKMLDWLSDRYSLLSADEFLRKLQTQSLAKDDICLSFDDALLCQADIAVPILRQRKIQAFFFIYSSPFTGVPDNLEIYRYFRTTAFPNVDAFYEEFFNLARFMCEACYVDAWREFDANQYLKHFPFYSDNDKWFRRLRDDVLGKERYEKSMSVLMRKHHFDPMRAARHLWMTDSHLRMLRADHHIVGLHSFSHPTKLHRMSRDQQAAEYEQNAAHLREVLNTAPIAMSHPCGNYDSATLDILTGLGIQIGFRSNLAVTAIKSPLEVPRKDHAVVLKEMAQ